VREKETHLQAEKEIRCLNEHEGFPEKAGARLKGRKKSIGKKKKKKQNKGNTITAGRTDLETSFC